jgi:hypothetical protein
MSSNPLLDSLFGSLADGEQLTLEILMCQAESLHFSILAK